MDRIERAARAAEDIAVGDANGRLMNPVEVAKAVLAAAYPELHSDPPTAWLAPMEATEAMLHARGDPYEETVVDSMECELIWEAMRDAYLRDTP